MLCERMNVAYQLFFRWNVPSCCSATIHWCQLNEWCYYIIQNCSLKLYKWHRWYSFLDNTIFSHKNAVTAYVVFAHQLHIRLSGNNLPQWALPRRHSFTGYLNLLTSTLAQSFMWESCRAPRWYILFHINKHPSHHHFFNPTRTYYKRGGIAL